MQETYKQATKQKAEPTKTIILEQGKRVLLLDLDKTIIFYNSPKGFHERPHLGTFLEAIKDLYTIYIFTAANCQYAK